MKNTRELLDSALAEPAKEALVNDDFIYESASTTVNALSSVINFIITDAFNLNPEDSLWVGYHLGEILSPLKTIIPTSLLGAVQRELESGEYSKRMFERNSRASYMEDSASFTEGVRYAPVSDWVEGVSEIVLGSYPTLRPMIRSSIIGGIHGLFLELGVSDDPRKSRASSYLPTSVRYLLGNN